MSKNKLANIASFHPDCPVCENNRNVRIETFVIDVMNKGNGFYPAYFNMQKCSECDAYLSLDGGLNRGVVIAVSERCYCDTSDINKITSLTQGKIVYERK